MPVRSFAFMMLCKFFPHWNYSSYAMALVHPPIALILKFEDEQKHMDAFETQVIKSCPHFKWPASNALCKSKSPYHLPL